MPTTARAAAIYMQASALLFVIICGSAQYWRHDLHWIDDPLSFYLYGLGGAYVRMAYYLIAAALLGFALAYCRVSAQPSTLATMLFAGAGITLPIVAYTENFRSMAALPLAQLIHGLCAQATFLWLSFAMLLASARWRDDAKLLRGNRASIALAWLATLVLWLQVLVPGLPHGLPQKLTIGLILIWLWQAARRISRAAASIT